MAPTTLKKSSCMVRTRWLRHRSVFLASALALAGLYLVLLRGGSVDLATAVVRQAQTVAPPINSPITLSLYSGGGAGPSAGLGFVDLYVGNPTQRRTLAVATENDFTAFPCGNCVDCGTSLRQYDGPSSSEFSPVSCGRCTSDVPDDEDQTLCTSDGALCRAAFRHHDGSRWRGYETRDVVYVGPALDEETGSPVLGTDAATRHGFELVFACQSSVRGRYMTQVRDGVFGMGGGEAWLRQSDVSGWEARAADVQPVL